MAVEIIEKGSLDNSPIYKRRCPECGTIFTYKYLDTIDSNWLGGCRVIPCPLCNYKVLHLIAGAGEDVNHPKLEDI